MTTQAKLASSTILPHLVRARTIALAVVAGVVLLGGCESTESTEVTKTSSSSSSQGSSPTCSRMPGDTCSESACCGISSPLADCYTFAAGATEGQCTSACTSDSQCKYVGMIPAKCVKFKSSSFCLFPCITNADCGGSSGQTCVNSTAGKFCLKL